MTHAPQGIKKGYEETLSIPIKNRDLSILPMRMFDTHFKNINNGMLNIAKGLSQVYNKVQNVENNNNTIIDI